MQLILFPFLVSALVSYFSTFFVIKLAWKWGLIDDPKKNKHPKVIHSVPTPRGGGLAIFIGVLVGSFVFLPLDKHLFGILLGGLILVVMGIADDKYNLSPYLRLAIQFVAALVPIAFGIGIAFWKPPFFNEIIDLSHPQINFMILGKIHSIWIISDIFALIWIVTLMNFLNWGAKGVDGQLTGVVVISAIVIAILSLRFSADITEWPVIILALITAGAYFGFLPWHVFPQKIMPSFSGSNLGGYLLGVLSILTTAKVGTLALVLGVPLIDSGYTVIRRVANGKSPFWGDRGHLHHRLMDNGWSRRQIMFFYWVVTAVLGILALNLNGENKFYTIVGVLLLVGGLILWLTYRPRK